MKNPIITQVMLNEMEETRLAIREFTNHAVNLKGYPFVAGVLVVVLEDAIHILPKKKRAEFRKRMLRLAQEQVNRIH